MKITKQHREWFKEALEYLDVDTSFCCIAINATRSSPQIKEGCKNILFHYFQNKPKREVLWLPLKDGLSYDETITCRIIALYTLIYAPL